VTRRAPTAAELEAERRLWTDPEDAAALAAALMEARPDPPAVTAERRRVLHRETAPRRRRALEGRP